VAVIVIDVAAVRDNDIDTDSACVLDAVAELMSLVDVLFDEVPLAVSGGVCEAVGCLVRLLVNVPSDDSVSENEVEFDGVMRSV